MKRLTQIFQALLGVVALILTALLLLVALRGAQFVTGGRSAQNGYAAQLQHLHSDTGRFCGTYCLCLL